MEAPETIEIRQSPVLHRQVAHNPADGQKQPVQYSPDTQKLIPFNGYYNLGNAPGAFFAIDANMAVSDAGKTVSYFINLILSLNGTQSYTIPFTDGSFDGTTLIQNSDTFSVKLTFERAHATENVTASLHGTVQIGDSDALIQVQGSTYNNPIESPLFAGTYFLPSGTGSSATYTQVLQIKADNSISYDFGSGDGTLKPVDAYTYNMNMYYYVIDNGAHSLIMGTAGASGLACNNMIEGKDGVQSRSLQTIKSSTMHSHLFPNTHSKELGTFSGYYPLPSIHAGAFLTILGQYTIIEGITIYSATISYSFDGETATGYDFGPEIAGFSFQNNVLTVNDDSGNNVISLTFERVYTASDMSLAQISGTIAGQTISLASTSFNPVPLSAFSGVPMTNADSSLNVINDGTVTYTVTTDGASETTTMDQFIYVPLMYILANPWIGTQTVLSLGTAGSKGNACIVIDVATAQNSFVYAIPEEAV